jgi:hypothetical protein
VDAVIGMRRLAVGAVELVRRIRHVAVRRPVIGLPGPPAAQGLIGVVEFTPHRRQPFVPVLVEAAFALCSPEPVLLGDQSLDLVQNGLLVHSPIIASRGQTQRVQPLGSCAHGD